MKILALGASLVLTAGLAVVPAHAQAPTPEGTYQMQILQATNKQRVKHDRAKFKRQKCVQKYAVRQASRMARQERLYHQDLGPILRNCRLTSVGENVAYGYPNGRTVVNKGWMRSEGHRRNILNGDFRLLGTGARQSDDGTWYAAQVFGSK